MTNNILACRCSNCFDTYNLGKVLSPMTDLEKAKFMFYNKTCLNCGKEYLPFGSTYNMDEFVFNAVRTVKM